MKTGLLIVDMQNDYFPGGKMELAGINEAALKAEKLLMLFRENQWPRFHVQHVALQDQATFFLPDTPGVAIHERVKPLPGEMVITKHFPNSFRETRLGEALEKEKIQRLVICGAMSHMCIDATTRAAADLGYECVVIQDACATRDLQFGEQAIPARQVHGAFMAALGSVYAKVWSLEAFVSNMRTKSKP
jgi:nicotinamidase-related amidase